MQKILTKIIKDKNPQTFLSIFSPNGVGKTTLSNKIHLLLNNEDYRTIKRDKLTSGFFTYMQDPFRSIFGDFDPHKPFKPKFKSIIIDKILQSKNNVLCSNNISTILTETSFAYNLKFKMVNIISEPNKLKNSFYISQYNSLEKKIPNISTITINKEDNLLCDSIYFCDSTDIQVETGFISVNKIEMIATIIEMLSSLSEISIYQFLNLYSYDYIFLHKYMIKKLEIIYTKIYNDKREYIYNYGKTFNLINRVKNFLNILREPLKIYSLIEFLKTTELQNRLKYSNYRNLIDDNNSIVINNFQECKRKFFQIFPYTFNDIILNKRYNSSLDIFLYDLIIINKANKKYSQFNFLNNIGSEGEKKLVNFFYLIMILLSLSSNTKYLITSDDALDSFDYSNSFNFFSLLKDILKDKSFLFLNLTHNFEQFKEFNQIFLVDNKNIFLMSRVHFNEVTLDSVEDFVLTNLAIKNNFYKNYLLLKGKKHIDLKDEIISLIAIIPYFRNNIEVIEGSKNLETLKNYVFKFITKYNLFTKTLKKHISQKDNRFQTATKLLHFKDNQTNNLTKLLDQFIFKNFSFMPNDKEQIISFLNNNPDYYKLLGELYDFVITNKKIDTNLLEYRIFLSIYARLLMEKTMADILKIDLISNPKKRDQTGILIKELKEYLILNPNNKYIEILEKIQYLAKFITPYIHNDVPYLIHLNIDNLKMGINSLLSSIKD